MWLFLCKTFTAFPFFSLFVFFADCTKYSHGAQSKVIYSHRDDIVGLQILGITKPQSLLLEVGKVEDEVSDVADEHPEVLASLLQQGLHSGAGDGLLVGNLVGHFFNLDGHHRPYSMAPSDSKWSYLALGSLSGLKWVERWLNMVEHCISHPGGSFGIGTLLPP